jgi:hypothetical protein
MKEETSMHALAVTPADRDTLPVLEAGGFGATVDAYAWEPDTDPANRQMRLWFLSLVGPQQALKALWARLLRGDLATLSLETLGSARFCTLAQREPRAWHSFTARLPTAGGHQLVLLPDAARIGATRPDILLLPRSEDEAPRLHWRFLDRRLDLPLRPAWATWLWERACRTAEAVSLDAFGTLAYLCKPNPVALAAEVSLAIRQRRLPGASVGAEVLSIDETPGRQAA